MGTFRGCFNFADFELSDAHVPTDNYRQKFFLNDRGGFNVAEKSSTANIAKLTPPRIFALLQ